MKTQTVIVEKVINGFIFTEPDTKRVFVFCDDKSVSDELVIAVFQKMKIGGKVEFIAKKLTDDTGD